MDLHSIEVGDVMIDVRGKMVVVTRVELSRPKNPVVYQANPGGGQYIAPASFFKVKIGKVDVEAFKAAAPKPLFGSETFLPPAPPASNFTLTPVKTMFDDLKVGDEIIVKHGSREVQAIFKGCNLNRPKYPVSYEINGRPWKGTWASVVRAVNKSVQA